jgi:hypothetical protein
MKFGATAGSIVAREFTFSNLERVKPTQLPQNRTGQTDRAPLCRRGLDRRFLSEQFAQHSAWQAMPFFSKPNQPLFLVKGPQSYRQDRHHCLAYPAIFNGFKIKAPWGGSAAPETTYLVEKLVDNHIGVVQM